MTFGNLIMLVGLAGVGVPLVLHLLSRARYRSVDWGAMMFLVGTDRRQRRSRRVRQWLLLSLRMLLVALVALAMSRPRMGGAASGGAESVAAVLVLDRSASMGVKENERTRMEAAKTAAIEILKQLDRHDEVTLLTTGDLSPAAGPSSDLPSLARQVADMEPADGSADMVQALERAADVLRTSGAARRDIYLVTDRQRGNWDGISPAWAQAWRKRLDSAPGTRVRLLVAPVGGEETANVSVESFTATQRPAVVNQPVEMEVCVRNYGLAPVAEVPLRVKEDWRTLFATTVSVAPKSQAVVRTQVTFGKTGTRVVSASVENPGYVDDNLREMAVQVQPPTRVLLVSGDDAEKQPDFFRMAVMPWKTSGQSGMDPAEVTELRAGEQWPDLDVGRFAVVVLADVPKLSEGQARELEEYVYSGGGLLIAAGPRMQTDVYNTLLYREGAGILPGELLPAPAGQAPVTIGEMDLGHASLRFLRQDGEATPTAAIRRFLLLARLRADTQRVVMLNAAAPARWPLLTECAAGRGRVMLLTSSLDTEWNDLPLSSFYLPWMQSLVRRLAGGNEPELNVTMGEPLTLTLPGAGAGTQAWVALPDGQRQPATVTATPAGMEASYAATSVPGRYTLTVRAAAAGSAERRWIFVVSPPTQESDLTPLSRERVDELKNLLGAQVVEPKSPEFAKKISRQRQERALWLPLLLAAVAVGLTEMAVAYWWGRR